MSGRSVTITIGTTGSIRTTPSNPNGVKLAGEESKDKMYEPKHSKKTVRVLTVIAYMFAVSLAAIILSAYYVLLWSPRHMSRIKYHMDMIAQQKVETTPVPVLSQQSLDDVKACCCSHLSNFPAGVDSLFSSSLSHPMSIQTSTEVANDRPTFNSQEDQDPDDDDTNNNIDITVETDTGT